jgi:hypothetical protein
MTRLLRISSLVVAMLSSAGLAGAQTPPAAPAEKSGPEGWDTIVYPVYGWLPLFGAEIRLPEQPNLPSTGGPSGGVTIPSAKTSGNFNGAAAAGFRLERGRFSLQSEFLWAGMSGDVEAPRLGLSVNTIYGQALGGFEVAPNLYAEGGVRRFALKMTASVLTFPEVTWKPGLWEPVVGMTFRPMLARKVRLMTHADIGGIGQDGHRTATATARIEWKPIGHLALGGGWGWLYLRADGTILTKPVHLQQTLKGPILTLGIPF